MNTETQKTSFWQRAKAKCNPAKVKAFVKELPKMALGLLSFSLLFMLGLITLGMSLLAGIAAILMAKWHQRQMVNGVANPTDKKTNDEPIAAV